MGLTVIAAAVVMLCAPALPWVHGDPGTTGDPSSLSGWDLVRGVDVWYADGSTAFGADTTCDCPYASPIAGPAFAWANGILVLGFGAAVFVGWPGRMLRASAVGLAGTLVVTIGLFPMSFFAAVQLPEFGVVDAGIGMWLWALANLGALIAAVVGASVVGLATRMERRSAWCSVAAAPTAAVAAWVAVALVDPALGEGAKIGPAYLWLFAAAIFGGVCVFSAVMALVVRVRTALPAWVVVSSTVSMIAAIVLFMRVLLIQSGAGPY